MPIELAILASFIRQDGDSVALIDLFGADPTRLSDEGDYYLQGDLLESICWQDQLNEAECFILYAISYMSHNELLALIRLLKRLYPKKTIAILENSQAVTAYSLPNKADEFLGAGATCLICGEPYPNWSEIKQYLKSPNLGAAIPNNLVTSDSIALPVRIAESINRYPPPAWDLINLNNYWSLPYSHGPKTKKFLPILTSRGCPYPCDFCVVPETNNRRWRGNKPEDVVDEIIELRDKFGVHDFQVEDLNPTVQHQRWIRICELLIERRAGVRFYFVSGTKAETIHIDQVHLYAKAGCRYISISPESGSARLMKIIGKKFDKEHGLKLINACREHKIKTQACFLVGHPDETHDDFLCSKEYLSQMIRSGVDEVAIFVVSPFAGSSLFKKNRIHIENSKALLSFSPRGREKYEILELRRKILIRTFVFEKLRKGIDFWFQGIRSVIGVPRTKMENLPRRIVYIYWLVVKNKIFANNRL